MFYLTNVWEILMHNPSTVIVAIGGMLLYFCFLRPRWKWWLYPVLVALTFFVMPMLIVVLATLFDVLTAYSILMACLGYWVDILVLISFRERFWAIITLLFTQGIFNRLFTFWGYLLHIPLNVMFEGDLDIGVSLALMFVVMYAIILFICWISLREKGKKLIQTDLGHHSWVILGSISVVAKLIIDFCSDYAFSLDPYSDIKIIWAMVALCLFAIVVLLLYLYSTFTTMKHLELKAATDRLTFEKSVQQRYYETQLHNQEELHRMKHDMNGHLNTVVHLLEEDKKDEVLRYLKGLGDYNNEHQKELYSDDPYINAVVANYATLFNDNDISFEYDIQLGKIELHYIEMCLALNNALQNALEAEQKLIFEERYVKLQIKTKQDRLLFRVTNRFNENINININSGFPHSTKESMGHGYGLISICDAAESVGGFTTFKIENDMFVLDVAM